MKVLKWMVLFSLINGPIAAQVDPLWKTYYDSTRQVWGRDWQRTGVLLERAEKAAVLDPGVLDGNYLTILGTRSSC